MAIPAIVAGLVANAPQIVAGAGAVGSVAGAVDKVNKAIQSTRKTIDGFSPNQGNTRQPIPPEYYQQQHNNQGINLMGLF